MNIEGQLPLMTLDEQIATAEHSLQKYREKPEPINSNVTLWFESIIESLHRLKSLER